MALFGEVEGMLQLEWSRDELEKWGGGVIATETVEELILLIMALS